MDTRRWIRCCFGFVDLVYCCVDFVICFDVEKRRVVVLCGVCVLGFDVEGCRAVSV